jgi:hypothetical protein
VASARSIRCSSPRETPGLSRRKNRCLKDKESKGRSPGLIPPTWQAGLVPTADYLAPRGFSQPTGVPGRGIGKGIFLPESQKFVTPLTAICAKLSYAEIQPEPGSGQTFKLAGFSRQGMSSAGKPVVGAVGHSASQPRARVHDCESSPLTTSAPLLDQQVLVGRRHAP